MTAVMPMLMRRRWVGDCDDRSDDYDQMFSKETVPQLLWVIVPCIAVSASGIVNVIVFTTSR